MKDRDRAGRDPAAHQRLRIAIVTARGAPAHKRVITTLRDWGLQVDEAFFRRFVRGRGGGFALARPPHEVTLMNVVEAMLIVT